MSNDAQMKVYEKGMLIGLLIGVLFLICGLVLLILGVTGSLDITGESGSFKATITNASPGIFLVLCGAIITLRFKPKIEVETKSVNSGGGGGLPSCKSCGKLNSMNNGQAFSSQHITYRANYKVDHTKCTTCGQSNGSGAYTMGQNG